MKAFKGFINGAWMGLILWVIILMLAGCANTRYYTEVGAGDNSGNWNDCGNTGTYFGLGARTELGSYYTDVGYSHYSQWSCGWPVNDDNSESFLNHWGVKGGYYF